MSTFDYPFLINRLSDKGFNHLKSLVFQLLDYQYITIKDIRRIDLCERVYQLSELYTMKAGQRKGMSLEAFFEVIENYIVNVFKCKAGTIAAEYRKYALDLIKETKKDKDDDEAIRYEKRLTLFSVYLGLAREIFPNYTKISATDLHLLVDENDAVLLQEIREYKPKTVIPGMLKINSEQSVHEKDLFFIHCTIFYCLLMEIEGKYGEGWKE